MILANSMFTARVFKTHFPTIGSMPTVVYPGINLAAYNAVTADESDPDVVQVKSYVVFFLQKFKYSNTRWTGLVQLFFH